MRDGFLDIAARRDSLEVDCDGWTHDEKNHAARIKHLRLVLVYVTKYARDAVHAIRDTGNYLALKGKLGAQKDWIIKASSSKIVVPRNMRFIVVSRNMRVYRDSFKQSVTLLKEYVASLVRHLVFALKVAISDELVLKINDYERIAKMHEVIDKHHDLFEELGDGVYPSKLRNLEEQLFEQISKILKLQNS